MKNIFKKYLTEAIKDSLTEESISDKKKRIENNPINKKIKQILEKADFDATDFYLYRLNNGFRVESVSSIRSKKWRIEPGVPDVYIKDGRLTGNMKAPEFQINVPAIGNEDLKDASKRFGYILNIIKTLEELSKLDWTKLEVFEDRDDDI